MTRYLTILNEFKGLFKTNGRDPCEFLIVAVSKGKSIEKLQAAYVEGCRDFGENRLSEALEKIQVLPLDICWHWIGALQRKKIAKIVANFSVIHSVDTYEVAQSIDRESEKLRRKTKIFLQVNISKEGSKRGFSKEVLESCFPQLLNLSWIQIQGLMTMTPYQASLKLQHHIFFDLRRLRDSLKTKAIPMPFLSMGMSQDYLAAIQEGATHLRIGSLIF